MHGILAKKVQKRRPHFYVTSAHSHHHFGGWRDFGDLWPNNSNDKGEKKIATGN